MKHDATRPNLPGALEIAEIRQTLRAANLEQWDLRAERNARLDCDIVSIGHPKNPKRAVQAVSANRNGRQQWHNIVISCPGGHIPLNPLPPPSSFAHDTPGAALLTGLSEYLRRHRKTGVVRGYLPTARRLEIRLDDGHIITADNDTDDTLDFTRLRRRRIAMELAEAERSELRIIKARLLPS